MRFLGVLLLFIGIFSSVMSFLEMNFIFLQWIDRWGNAIGWMIRGAFILIGTILYFLGKPSEEE